jgi:hypothetical protein
MTSRGASGSVSCRLWCTRSVGIGVFESTVTWWAGRGAVLLLDVDLDARAMLLERLSQTRSLPSEPLSVAIPLIAELVRELAVPAPPDAPATCAIAADLVSTLDRDWSALGGPTPRTHLDTARDLADQRRGRAGRRSRQRRPALWSGSGWGSRPLAGRRPGSGARPFRIRLRPSAVDPCWTSCPRAPPSRQRSTTSFRPPRFRRHGPASGWWSDRCRPSCGACSEASPGTRRSVADCLTPSADLPLRTIRLPGYSTNGNLAAPRLVTGGHG